MSDRRRMLLGERAELVEKARELNARFKIASRGISMATIESDLEKVNENEIEINARNITAIKKEYVSVIKRIREITDEVDGDAAPAPVI